MSRAYSKPQTKHEVPKPICIFSKGGADTTANKATQGKRKFRRATSSFFLCDFEYILLYLSTGEGLCFISAFKILSKLKIYCGKA